MGRKPTNFKNSKLSIIVPVFNEARHIRANLDLLLEEVEEYFPRFEIIVVSDGSTDGTNSKLNSLKHPDIRPIVVDKNTGKGNAVREGFQRATGDFILFIDGGMEIHPREIRIFMGLMQLYECDIVIGSKRHPQARIQYPWYRHLLSWSFQVFVRWLLDVDVTDTQVGIKLFRRPVIDAILPNLEINRYGFDLEILTLAKINGYKRVLEAPIRLDYFGRSERPFVTDLFHVFKVGFSLIKDTWQLYRRLRTMKRLDQPAEDETTRQAG